MPAAASNTFEDGLVSFWTAGGVDDATQAYAGTHSRKFTAASVMDQFLSTAYAFLRFRLRISSASPAVTFDQTSILTFEGTTWTAGAVRLWLVKTAGGFGTGLSQGTTSVSSVAITADVWHDVAIEVNQTALTAKLWINQNPVTATPAHSITFASAGGGVITRIRAAAHEGWQPDKFVTNWDEHYYWTAFPTPSAALTGTALASITEADIRAGGKTIVMTLTNETVIPN